MRDTYKLFVDSTDNNGGFAKNLLSIGNLKLESSVDVSVGILAKKKEEDK